MVVHTILQQLLFLVKDNKHKIMLEEQYSDDILYKLTLEYQYKKTLEFRIYYKI